jgi:hypothetical protein
MDLHGVGTDHPSEVALLRPAEAATGGGASIEEGVPPTGAEARVESDAASTSPTDGRAVGAGAHADLGRQLSLAQLSERAGLGAEALEGVLDALDGDGAAAMSLMRAQLTTLERQRSEADQPAPETGPEPEPAPELAGTTEETVHVVAQPLSAEQSTVVPVPVWIPESIELVSFSRQQNELGDDAKSKTLAAAGGAMVGAMLLGGPVGLAVGAIGAGIAANQSLPTTHIEFTLSVTCRGMHLDRQIRWSEAEELAKALKAISDRLVSTLSVANPDAANTSLAGRFLEVSQRLPTKIIPLDDRLDAQLDPRVAKRRVQLAAFLASVCELWREVSTSHGPRSSHARVFINFFKLPGANEHSAEISYASEQLAVQPQVGAEYGDWRVSRGVLVAMATPVAPPALPAMPVEPLRDIDATHEVLRAAVVKAGPSRESSLVSTLVRGDAIKVLESREIDGVTRLRFFDLRIGSEGWVSTVSSSGNILLQPL